MKNIYLFCLVVAPIIWCNAQSPDNVEDALFKVNALTPGVSYEIGVGNDFTMNFDALVGIAGGSRGPNDVNVGIFPGLQAELRYYTNMQRRLARDKNIAGNSGNYISMNNGISSGIPIIGTYELASDFYYSLSFEYGLQRMSPKGFYWQIALGPALLVDDFDIGPGASLNATLGWVIGKNKTK
ncbi:unnamed protein product [Ectocarpus sp. 12 AP-2014]